MKLAIKLSSALILGMLALLVVDACVTVRRETAYFLADMQRDAALLGHAMKALTTDAWRSGGQQRALQLIDDANRGENLLKIRWVWLDDTGGTFAPKVPGLAQRLHDAGNGTSVSVSSGGQDEELITYVPIPVDPHRRGALELSESMSQLVDYRQRMVTRSLGLVALLLGVGAATITVLGTWIVGRPLAQLAERVRGIGQGDLETELNLAGGDELGELADTLNRMCRDLASARQSARRQSEARIATLEQLRHADRLATVGRLASGIAHEVGTPLNVISARAGQIERASPPGTVVREHAAIVARQSERIAGIVRQLLTFARPGRADRQRLDLAELAQRVVGLLQPLAARQGVTLSPVDAVEQSPRVNANRYQLEHVLANLIDNAIQAMAHGGEIRTRVGTAQSRPPWDGAAPEIEVAILEVEDQGTGIAGDILPKIFDPFFTTKDVGEGTGLGLSLAFGIVREHEGWIDVASEVNRGSRFTVYLPLAPGGQCPPGPEGAGARPAQATSPVAPIGEQSRCAG